jgi:hypothetical protein
MKDERSRKAIDQAERFSKGDVELDELRVVAAVARIKAKEDQKTILQKWIEENQL